MKSLYNRITEKVNTYKESSRQEDDLKSLIRYLYVEENIDMENIYNICKDRLEKYFDEDAFLSSAFDIRLEGVPYGGYVAEDGSTVIYGSEETC